MRSFNLYQRVFSVVVRPPKARSHNSVDTTSAHRLPPLTAGPRLGTSARGGGAAEGGAFTLEVVCYARASLQVIALLNDLSFASSTYTRRGRSGEFRLCGDPATLDAAAARLSATPFAVCVLEEVVD